MKSNRPGFCLLLQLITSIPCVAGLAGASGDLLLNQIQVIGTHNSYRTRPPAVVWKWMQSLPATAAGDPKDLDYSHPPLPAQLDAGMRSVELDLYADPDGGRFARRAGMTLTGGEAEAPVAEGVELKQPGCKILHLPDFDFGTTCPSLRTALSQLKSWSDAHREHMPIVVHLETKDETIRSVIPLPGLTKAAPWDAAACDALDVEIREAFVTVPGRVFTPPMLRGQHPTLEAAARAGAWPALSAMRGRILFVMEGVAVSNYTAGHPSLEGRQCFIYGEPGRAEAAFLLINDAARQRDTIARRVREGYMVRTRADAGTTQARNGDTTRRDAALASGAQITSTDYPSPDPRGGKEPGWTTYCVQFPGKVPARPNPVCAPAPAQNVVLSE